MVYIIELGRHFVVVSVKREKVAVSGKEAK
jgi:hypothetical protein